MTLIPRQTWKKECGRARTCPVWRLASQKRPTVCAALLSEFVHSAVRVFEFACVCQQYPQSFAFIAQIPLTVQMADRCFVFSETEVKLKNACDNNVFCFFCYHTAKHYITVRAKEISYSKKRKGRKGKRSTEIWAQGWCTGTFLVLHSIWHISQNSVRLPRKKNLVSNVK